MSQYSKLAMGAAAAALSLMPCLAQRATLDVDKVANWPAPLYWQSPAPSGQGDSSGRTAPGEAKPRVETAQVNETAVFVAITPCRLVDTRNDGTFPDPSTFGGPSMGAASTRVFPVPSGSCSLPATAVAYSFNIAVVPTGTTMRWLTAWPDGDTKPTLATLNDKAGLVTSNAAIVAAGNAGAVDIYVEDATDVIVDTNGYYALPANLPFAGSAAAPALTFGDTTTGLYSAGAGTGTVDIAAEGTNVAAFSATGLSVPGNLDFGGEITQGGAALLRSSSSTNDVYLGFGNASLVGTDNSALGSGALNSVGATSQGNTGVGFDAGKGVGNGKMNVAVGNDALTSGGVGYSTAVGAFALSSSSNMFNTALGYAAGMNLTTGTYNTYVGDYAGFTGNWSGTPASTGSYNTFVGANAGSSATTGSHNVFIANPGTAYPDTESNTIRIGDPDQSKTFISGISGTTTGLSGALPVVIDTNGQLGTVSSSRRVKTDIADMGDTTETLMGLRPVQFRYIAYGPASPLQYGLIAEEVAEIAPELVAHDATGEIQTVYYDKVNAMLLNQVQTQQRQIETQKEQFQSQLEQQQEQFTRLISQLESRLAELESRAK
jgi:hypothetical protein